MSTCGQTPLDTLVWEKKDARYYLFGWQLWLVVACCLNDMPAWSFFFLLMLWLVSNSI
jgi:hypothetical protein